jgi:hypothetical protein
MKAATIWGDASNIFSATNLPSVAAAVVSILGTAETETCYRFVYIESLKTSQYAIVAALEKAVGEKWTIEKTTTEEQLGASQKLLQSGDTLSAFYTWIVAGIFSGDKGIKFGDEELDNKLLGLKEEGLEGAVEGLLRQ